MSDQNWDGLPPTAMPVRESESGRSGQPVG